MRPRDPTMNRLKLASLAVASLIAALDIRESCGETNAPADVQVRLAKFRELFDQILPMDIHGKVIDQDSNGVAGVQIKIGWQGAGLLIGDPDPGKVSLVVSDDSGRWEFRIDKPHRAFVVDASKHGYEYLYTRESDMNLVDNRTTRDEPAIVRLRKKAEATFLIRHKGYQLIRVLSPGSQTNTLDLLEAKGDKSRNLRYADLQVKADYDRMTDNWAVTYSVANGSDGVVISNDRLYEAPQEGYREEFVVSGPPWPRYVYLRTRTPPIYSRIDLDHTMWKESDTNQGFRISYKAWINPYGDRNLEYEVGLEREWRLADRLEREARSSLLQNERPSKPDLPSLLKEVKEE